ncbi:MAG: LysM peptidoglycan-binding domain-containing protein [Gemmatimonadota bacterium]|nr:LysM peptidoglycan-binding domain-containing protein [Gemmatimonadota bacterium]MDH5197835.1 LysM peptidoglycan-binding domain-containing protein [Gemmatimonadota bacterium]
MRLLRGLTSALLLLTVGGACARPAALPAPAPAAGDGPEVLAASPDPGVLDDALVTAADDSAADRAVLDALAELEFGSLDRRAGRVRGQADPAATAASGAIAGESVPLFAAEGGPAAAGDVTRLLDVESFANHSRVQYYIDFFQGPARDRFTIWLGRLPRYEGMIRDQMRRFGVPDDLVYLAMIESGYSNTAVSRAKAVGMWQFIAGTGRRYGLQQDVWEDQRRDPFRATEAAARHLADLNEEFGSWYLAAAAYNAGAGRVSRGLRRLPGGPAGSGDSTFFELSDRRYLRLETRDYVPKLIAAALIAKDPARYGFDSVPRFEPLRYDEVIVSDATGLDVLARLADTTTRALVELNPQFVRGATPPKRSVVVRVPAGAGAAVSQRWAELPAKERITFVTHRVVKGETLSEIAKRYGVSTTVLQAANPAIQPRRMRIGQTLTVPVSTAAQRSATRTTTASPAPAPSRNAAYYTVRSGDSLWVIAQRHGVAVGDLKSWNDLSGTVVRVGQELRVRAP